MHTPEPTPSATASQTPEPAPTETPCVPPEGWVVYTVLPGETLYSIAARYGMSAEELQQANCLPSAGEIQSGQSLYVPWQITPTPTLCFPPASWVPYTVLPGETLYSIAARYGLTAGQLQQANCLSSAGVLRAGQDLYVPYLIPPTQAIPPPPSGGGGAGEPEPEDIPDLKKELFFTLGGGGGNGFGHLCFDSMPEGDSTAILGYGRLVGTQEPGGIISDTASYTIPQWSTEDDGELCLYGFLFDEEITIDLYLPSGELGGSGTFRIEPGDTGDLNTIQVSPELSASPIVGSARVISDVNVIAISIWLPASLPSGLWSAEARSASKHAGSTFQVVGPGQPAVSTMPVASVTPFDDYRCESYLYPRDGQVLVRGMGFEPDTWFAVGFYYLTEGPEGIFRLAVLKDDKVVHTDDQGSFLSAATHIGVFEPGTYIAVPKPDDRDETEFLVSCFLVSE
jgi:LysM repeat protein